jgi:hypothetical protein
LALHSLPADPTFRSSADNGVPDPAATLRTAGIDSYWTSVREDRLQYAVWQWDVYTDWNPTLNKTAAPADCQPSTSCQGIWIDGSALCGAFPFGLPAYNCVRVATRHDVEGAIWFDIEDWDIFFNTAAVGHPNWCYSATCPQEPAVYDFQGVVTHELGHAIRLVDLAVADCNYGPDMYTMCGQGNGYPDSTRLRTITNDDIAGANVTY